MLLCVPTIISSALYFFTFFFFEMGARRFSGRERNGGSLQLCPSHLERWVVLWSGSKVEARAFFVGQPGDYIDSERVSRYAWVAYQELGNPNLL